MTIACLRVTAYKHIPEKEKEVSGKEKKTSDYKMRLNFPPYVHYAIIDGTVQIVAKSHHNKKEEFTQARFSSHTIESDSIDK